MLLVLAVLLPLPSLLMPATEFGAASGLVVSVLVASCRVRCCCCCCCCFAGKEGAGLVLVVGAIGRDNLCPTAVLALLAASSGLSGRWKDGAVLEVIKGCCVEEGPAAPFLLPGANGLLIKGEGATAACVVMCVCDAAEDGSSIDQRGNSYIYQSTDKQNCAFFPI
jgi:hypothetical protein